MWPVEAKWEPIKASGYMAVGLYVAKYVNNFFFSSRRRHTRCGRDWSSDVCSSDLPPTKVGGSVADLAAAFLAFGAVNAALVHRLRTGQGQHLDANLLASTLALLPYPVAHYLDSGTRPGRGTDWNPHPPPPPAVHTKEGWGPVGITHPDPDAR